KEGCLDENDFFKGSDGEKYEVVCEPGGYKVEYFKVEPVKWRILEERDGFALILSEDIIGVKDYGVWAKYIISNARDWLHDTFYKRAFTAGQKAIIQETKVDNSAESTGDCNNPNACEDTLDFLFLLSRKEAERYLTVAERAKRPTPYAEAASAYKNCGEWWLRSPAGRGKIYAQYVEGNGEIDNEGLLVFLSFECLDTVDSTPDTGIVPAMWIKL
ncbi:MAG: hypothetical protein K2N30_02000, partial [Clostridia bacterium]|nr:hypothetical protein [Clostridia bacterium]